MSNYNLAKILMTCAFMGAFSTGSFAQEQDSQNTDTVTGEEEVIQPKPFRETNEHFAKNYSNSKSYKQEVDTSLGGWANGWIATSYHAPIGGVIDGPTGYPIDTWLDTGNGLFSTDYLFAFAGERTFLYNAGTLREGSIFIDKPARYRIHLHTERYNGKGRPTCNVRFAIDSTTIIDHSSTMSNLGTKAVNKRSLRKPYKMNQYSENTIAVSPVLDIPETGYYGLDFWSYCYEGNAQNDILKLAAQFGNVTSGGFLFWEQIKTERSFYMGDDDIISGVARRVSVSHLKSNIQDNFGTMFDIVLENMETGEKTPIRGDTIWHMNNQTPKKNILRQRLEPRSGVEAMQGWVYKTERGELTNTYHDVAAEAPNWATAIMNAPFHPDYVEARKSITLKEDGVYGLAFGYDPKNSPNAAVAQLGGQGIVQDRFAAASTKSAIAATGNRRPTSDYMEIYLVKVFKDGTRKRVKLLEDVFKGAGYVGEIKFSWVPLKAGKYELLVIKNAKKYDFIRNKYGELTAYTSLVDDDAFSLRIKQPSDATFKLIR